MKKKEQATAEDFEQIYQNALLLIEGKLYFEAADEFARIPDYKDAAEKKAECEKLQATAKLDDIYNEADKAAANMNVRSQEKAIAIFERIPGYRDSEERIEQAKQRIEQIKEKEKADREEGKRIAEEKKKKAKKRRKIILLIAASLTVAAAACVAGVFFFKKNVKPKLQYNEAMKQLESGSQDDAYLSLHGLNYEDSSEVIYTIAKERLEDAELGDTVLFGAYPQGRITSEEKTPIEWLVIGKEGSRLLLISLYALDALPYMRYDFGENDTSVRWETSLLRDWLNNDFMNKAFDPGEQRMIETTTLKTVSMNGVAEITEDRVFLLSIGEARRYFDGDSARKCVATKYALGFGAYRSNNDATCYWWLRTPNNSDEMANAVDGDHYSAYRVVCVGTSGQIIEVGHEILNCYAVRPVIWVNIEAGEN